MLHVRFVTMALAALMLFPGCGFIHFGRNPAGATSTGDAGTAEAYTALATEHKILKQELALVRKEGDALRATIERAGSFANAPELAVQLSATTRELAALRARHAQLQAQRQGAADTPASHAQFTELEEKLAVSLRTRTELQEETARIRSEVQRLRIENTTLAEQVKAAAAREEQAQSALAQLNTELLAHKDARARADQAAAAAHAQLSAVIAAGADGSGTATRAAMTLQLAKAPPADASPTAELRTDPRRLRLAGADGGTPAPAPSPRTHIVAAGDTLEKLAQKYFGTPEQWRQIYEANEKQLGNGRPLTVGMKLDIPSP